MIQKIAFWLDCFLDDAYIKAYGLQGRLSGILGAIYWKGRLQRATRSWAKNYITSKARKVREIKTFTVFPQDPGTPLTDKNDLLQIQVLTLRKF